MTHMTHMTKYDLHHNGTGLVLFFLYLFKNNRMKKIFGAIMAGLVCLTATGQGKTETDNNTLLWRISGKDLSQPSYLFGTIHMLCASDLELSDSLRTAIRNANEVYLELDMDNMIELMGVMSKMKMNGDTTLADLLSPDEYKKIRKFFADRPSVIPFALLEKYKPMLAASSLMEADMSCKNPVSMEQLVMTDAKSKKKKIRGLETMAFQLSIFDSIPYKLQAKQLLKYVEDYGKEKEKEQYQELITAYMSQQLEKLGKLTQRDETGIKEFMDILVYQRNENWVAKLKNILPEKSVVVAVGAGHLPGEKGVINLLRKAGYKVEPVANNMLKKFEKQL
jgi:uncharacterized protein